MRMNRAVIGLGLAVVGVSALFLSFSTLAALAVLCGYIGWLSWLFPILLDAGATVGAYAWLAGDVPEDARQFARGLAIGLLLASVALNALAHALAAAGGQPHWVVVVLVTALAPGVLAAVVHLAALVWRPGDSPGEPDSATPGELVGASLATPGDASLTTPGDQPEPDFASLATEPGDTPGEPGVATPGDGPLEGRARELVAAGAGRGTLAKELDLSPHQARQLLARVKPTVNGRDVS